MESYNILAIRYIELEKEVEILESKLHKKKIELKQIRENYFLNKENKEQTRLT